MKTEKSPIFSTGYAGPEPEDLAKLQPSRIWQMPRPEELVAEFQRGASIENLTQLVYASRVFRKKTQARSHVERCIYKAMMKEGK